MATPGNSYLITSPCRITKAQRCENFYSALLASEKGRVEENTCSRHTDGFVCKFCSHYTTVVFRRQWWCKSIRTFREPYAVYLHASNSQHLFKMCLVICVKHSIVVRTVTLVRSNLLRGTSSSAIYFLDKMAFTCAIATRGSGFNVFVFNNVWTN